MSTNTVDPAQPTPSTVVVATDGSVTVTQVSNATTVTYPGVFATPFSPLDLSPTLWLDASDETTITESGGAVSQWDDKSGNNNDVTQATGTAQPTTGTRTINSLNVIDYDGSDQLANASLNFTQPITVYAVVETDLTDSASHSIISNTAWSAYLRMFSTSLNAFAGNTVSNAAGISTGQPFIVQAVFNGASSEVGRDGSVTTGDAGTTSWTGTIIGHVQFNKRWDGAIAEVIVVENTLTAQQKSDTETYLADKWGITL